jgi:multimeric flavodoxin WrbA
MLAATKAVIVASPINWNTMSARLKIFLDWTTCMQNLYHFKKPGLTEAKVAGILICGHKDGGIKTATDIFLKPPADVIPPCAVRVLVPNARGRV